MSDGFNQLVLILTDLPPDARPAALDQVEQVLADANAEVFGWTRQDCQAAAARTMQPLRTQLLTIQSYAPTTTPN